MRLTIIFVLAGLVWSAPGLGQEKKDPPLKIKVELPKEVPTVEQVNQGQYKVAVFFENVGREEFVLWPYLSVDVLDGKGQAVKRSRNLGRWGLRRGDSIIEGIRFVTLKPGERHRVEVSLSHYGFDPDFIRAWRLAVPGEYQLVLHYHYDRAAVKKRYGSGAKDLDAAEAPWNKALEVDEKVEAKFMVKASGAGAS